MTSAHAIILGLVQGLTEFLPVSSSGHLILVPKLLGWPEQSVAFDAMIHMGTALAAIWFYRLDCWTLLRSLWDKSADQETKQLRNAIIVATIPAVIVGLALKDAIDSLSNTVWLIAANLIIWAVVMIVADQKAKDLSATTTKSPSLASAGVVGLAQALALLPGTSRSGSTIAVGMFTGLSRSSAVRFSFLLGLPIILGVSGLSSIKLLAEVRAGTMSLTPLILGLVTSFIGGLFAIRILLRFLEKRALSWFAAYRIALALFILIVLR